MCCTLVYFCEVCILPLCHAMTTYPLSSKLTKSYNFFFFHVKIPPHSHVHHTGFTDWRKLNGMTLSIFQWHNVHTTFHQIMV
jgi:hypothetical protein